MGGKVGSGEPIQPSSVLFLLCALCENPAFFPRDVTSLSKNRYCSASATCGPRTQPRGILHTTAPVPDPTAPGVTVTSQTVDGILATDKAPKARVRLNRRT